MRPFYCRLIGEKTGVVVVNTSKLRRLLIDDKSMKRDYVSKTIGNETRPKNTFTSTTPMSSKKYVCGYCSFTSHSQVDIKSHLKTVHYIATPLFTRKVSNILIKDPLSLSPSRIPIKYTCAFCSKTFRSKVGIKRHLKEAHDGVVASANDNTIDHACPDCGKKFASQIKLNRHSKRCRKTCTEVSICDVCGKTLTNPQALRRHKNTSHKDPLVDGNAWVGTASATTPAEDKLADSLVVRINNMKHYQCDKCQYNSKCRNRIIEHYRTHTGERPYFCEKCGKQFTNLNLLQNHSLRVHEGAKKFSCGICSKTFANKQYVEEHRRTHTGEKQSVCHLCGAAFIYRSNLRTHMSKHDKLRKYKCSLCPETYLYPTNLMLHMRKHRGEYRFKCKECGKEFLSGQHLSRHMAVHSDARPFPCGICGAMFKLKKHVWSHMKTHENKK